ncbi:MAG TPA: GTP cyclohydrolase II [Bryobacteraceae bacterium]|jgi:GTP cyclohydrolase II
MSQNIDVRKVAEADFPSRFGHFRIFGFESCTAEAAPEEAVALVMGDVAAGNPPLVRIHSQCLTGDVFHSLRCDCGAQLELALESIAAEGRGVLIYDNQEGRGIGLLNKLRAYELQDGGADTVEANQQLGFQADLRGYELAGGILRYLGLTAVRLMSNNPQKIQALEDSGVRVAERIPSIIPPIASTEDYLRTKRDKLGHLFDPDKPSDDPFLGVWELDPSTLDYQFGRPGRRAIYTIEVPPKGVGFQFTLDADDADGKRMHHVYGGNLDGTEVPIPGHPVTLALRRVDQRRIESVLKREGKVADRWMRTLAADGQTMTITQHGVTPEGREFVNTGVYRRVR